MATGGNPNRPYRNIGIGTSLNQVPQYQNPHEGKIMMVNHLSFTNSSSFASSGPAVLVIDDSQLTTENIGVKMYPSLMETFKFLTPLF